MDVPFTVTTKGPTYIPGGTAVTWQKTVNGVKSVPVVKTVKPYLLILGNYDFQKVIGFTAQADKGYLSPTDVSWQETYQYRSDVTRTLDQVSPSAKRAYNRAYEKLLVRYRGDTADLLALFAERKAAGEMIFNRLHQLGQLIDNSVDLRLNSKLLLQQKDWRKSKVRKLTTQRTAIIARIAALTASTPTGVMQKTSVLRKNQSVFSTPAELILEMRWGWLPMVSDIYTALDTFHRNMKFPVRGNDFYGIDVDRSVTGSYTGMTQGITGKFKIAIGGDINIMSGVFGEFERLGISNPLQALWEITPYSWLIDWVANVGEFISSLDDSLAIKLDNIYLTRTVKAVETGRYWTHSGVDQRHYQRRVVYMKRDKLTSVPLPKLELHTPDMSFWRWATLSSLVVLKLKSVKTLRSLGK
jgi:hypothetical protein